MKPAAYAVLDLNAARHNLQKVRGIAGHAKVQAVIKANGYGHGLERIAHALRDVDGYAVARVQEGIRLRKSGITKPIAVLGGFTCNDELDALLNFGLDTVVHNYCQIGLLSTRAKSPKLQVWLKLDTGMNRLGFHPQEFEAVLQRLQACPVVHPAIHFMTHLANSDDMHDPCTLKQIELFKQTIAGYPGQCSIANSAGILGWHQALTDWVRPGIMLYGISPFAGQTGLELGLKPIMSLHSRLISVKPIEKGERVGYAGTWVCDKPTLLGVVAIGYGDGYPRYAKAGTPVLINGRRAPLIGRVSMDMLTVDLGGHPHAKPGDTVTLWGQELPVEEIALCAETIPYTLVCGVTQRVVQIADS